MKDHPYLVILLIASILTNIYIGYNWSQSADSAGRLALQSTKDSSLWQSRYNVLSDSYNTVLADIAKLKQQLVDTQLALDIALRKIPTIKVEVQILRDFPDLQTLQRFLTEDTTNRMKYIPSIEDCDDFAIQLSTNAAAVGYKLYPQIDPKRPTHMKNMAIIGNSVYMIEPQDDSLYRYATVD